MIRHRALLASTLAAATLLGSGGTPVAAQDAATRPADASHPGHPLELRPDHAPLKLLPPSAIRPQGWLRDWARTMADGGTGHLDEYDLTGGDRPSQFRDCPFATDQKVHTLDLERVAYWVEGMHRLGESLEDQALIDKADASLRGMMRLEPTDNLATGVLHSPTMRAVNTYLDETGDPKALAFLDTLYTEHFPDTAEGIRGLAQGGWWRRTYSHTNEILRAYEHGGDPELLDIGRTVYTAMGEKLYQTQLTPDHAVAYTEALKVLPGVMPWLEEASERERVRGWIGDIYDWLEVQHMQPFGIPSGDESMKGRDADRGSETCVVAEYLWSTAQAARATGERRYGDLIERGFFNAGPVTMSRDGKRLIYFQHANRVPLRGLLGVPYHGANLYADQSWTSCCTGNVHRVLPSFLGTMWMRSADGGLAAVLHGPSSVTWRVGDDQTPVTITSDTLYPFRDTITFRIEPERAAAFPLHLRLPAWCRSPTLKVNGEPVEIDAGEESGGGLEGFATIRRPWKAGDVVELTLPRAVRVEAIEQPREKGAAKFIGECVTYGPLLFALPVDEVDENTPVEGAEFRYALPADLDASQIEVTQRPMPERWTWHWKDSPLVMRVRAVPIEWEPEVERTRQKEGSIGVTEWPSPGRVAVARGVAEREVELVPYGTTRMRIATFPVAEVKR